MPSFPNLIADDWTLVVGGAAGALIAIVGYAAQKQADRFFGRTPRRRSATREGGAAAITLLTATTQIVGLALAGGSVGAIFVASIRATVGAFDHGLDIESIPPTLPLIVGVMVSVLLFRLRAANKVAYGVLELFFAATAMMLTSSRGAEPLGAATAIGFAAAIYVFIRGLTNVSDGLPPNRRLWFDRLFLGQTAAVLAIQEVLRRLDELAEEAERSARLIAVGEPDEEAAVRIVSMQHDLGVQLVRALQRAPRYERVVTAMALFSNSLVVADPFFGQAADAAALDCIRLRHRQLRSAIKLAARALIPKRFLQDAA